MKIQHFVFLLTSITLNIAIAETGFQTGKVDEIVVAMTSIRPDADYVSLKNLSDSETNISQTACNQFHDRYIFRIKSDNQGDQLITQLMLAKQADYTVQILVDDSQVDSDRFCFIKQLITTPKLFKYR